MIGNLFKKKKIIIHKKYDFHDNQHEIGAIQSILAFLCDNGYEIIDFNRTPSHQNPHYDNISFTAIGTKQLKGSNGRDFVFSWWGGDLMDAIHKWENSQSN